MEYIPKNNAQDIDLGSIITKDSTTNANFQSENALVLVLVHKRQQPGPLQMDIFNKNIQLPVSVIALVHAAVPASIPTRTSNHINLIQANNFPLIPKMYFPYNNVTINKNPQIIITCHMLLFKNSPLYQNYLQKLFTGDFLILQLEEIFLISSFL